MKQETEKLIEAGILKCMELARLRRYIIPNELLASSIDTQALVKDMGKMLRNQAKTIENLQGQVDAYRSLVNSGSLLVRHERAETYGVISNEVKQALDKLAIVCTGEFNLTVPITSKARKKNLIHARCCFCFMAREFFQSSIGLFEIGNYLKRHHSTVINSIRVYGELSDTNKDFRLKAESIKSQWLEGMKKAGL